MQTRNQTHTNGNGAPRGRRNGASEAKDSRGRPDALPEAPEIDEARPAARGKTEKKTLELPEIEINELPLRIVGLSPLIVHAWSKKSLQMMRDKQQKAATAQKAAKNPEEDFEGAKYKHPKTGVDCVRAHFFKNAIVSACRYVDDLKMTVIRGALFVEGDYLPLKFDECVMREDTVRVGQGTADLRYRPEYRDWSCDVIVSYNARVVSAEQVVNLIRLAGFSVGLCEWRPERDGIYGRFDVEPMTLTPSTRKRKSS